MTISAATGYFDWAVWEPLPLDRIYSWNNSMKRIYHHSLEGRRGSYTAYNDPNRYPTGWHGTVAYDGTLYQHAPVWAGLAHGGPLANPFGPGFEAEGVAGEPLTPEQVATYLRIHANMEGYRGIKYIRDGTNADFRLVEHREAAQTSCPSGRYAPLWAAILEEEDMTPEQVDAAISAKLDEALGPGFLALLEQMTGIKESTFDATNKPRADAIVARLGGPHRHQFDLAPLWTGEAIP